MSLVDRVWDRVLVGQHVVLIGHSVPPAPPRRHKLVRIDCAGWKRPLGPLLELRERLTSLIDDPDHLARGTTIGGTREGPHLGKLIKSVQRRLDAPLVIAVEAIQVADPETLRLLERLLTTGSLGSGILLQCASQPPEAVGRLIDAATAVHGDAVIVRREEGAPPSRRAPEVQTTPELAIEVRRVLRAAAAVGDTFEADIAAGLLGMDPFTILELLQLAVDQGVGLEDRGHGIFRLPEGLGPALRASTIPSLAASWHSELAAVMREADNAPVDEEPRPRREPPDLVEIARKWQERDFSSRAAEHAEAAGAAGDAARHYLDAAEEAAQIGGHARALDLVRHALRLLPVADDDAPGRRTRVRALLTQGHVLWFAAGAEPGATLEEAVAPLEEARELLLPGDPPELRAEVLTQIARVCYDIGDAQHFGRALAMLRDAQELLMHAGKPQAAARLLNDEAAVLIRTGDLERAAQLLTRSREVFLRHANESLEARRELAETDHLVARLPLHAHDEAHAPEELAFAVECAKAAEEAFTELDDERERARVRETLGRLARRQGRPEDARWLLSVALQTQQRIGDAVGLARTTGALAELLTDAGLHNDALKVLSDSVALNLQTGSAQGLAYNRSGLEDLAGKLNPGEPHVARAIAELRAQIE